MKRLSALFLILCIFITGCNTTNSNPSPIDNTTTSLSEYVKETTKVQPTTTKIPEITKAALTTTKLPETTAAPAEPTVPSSFVVHFIDVGQADAALVLCDGKSMLIDGGNAEDSDLIYTYLKKLNITYLNYIIATHAHEDHVGGLSAPLSGSGLCSKNTGRH